MCKFQMEACIKPYNADNINNHREAANGANQLSATMENIKRAYKKWKYFEWRKSEKRNTAFEAY